MGRSPRTGMFAWRPAAKSPTELLTYPLGKRSVQRLERVVDGRVRRVTLPDDATFIQCLDERVAGQILTHLDPTIPMHPTSDAGVRLRKRSLRVFRLLHGVHD